MHENTTFENSTVQLDGQEFRSCTFRDCQLTYGGGKPPVLVGCKFYGLSMAFTGAAADTLTFVTALYHGGFKGFIEKTIANIRNSPKPGPWSGTVH